MMKKVLIGFAVTVSLCCFCSNSFALAISYTDRVAWLADVNNVTTEDFESYNWGDSYVSFGSSASFAGVDYSFTGGMYGIAGTYSPDLDYLDSNYLYLHERNALLTIDFNQSITAAAFDFGNYYGLGGNVISVTLGTGDIFSPSNVENDYEFFGVTSNTAFTSLTILTSSAGTSIITLDNISFADYDSGASTAVPEPATMVLFGTGLAGLVGAARRKKK